MEYGLEGGSNGLFGSHLDINISSYCDRDHEYEYFSPGRPFVRFICSQYWMNLSPLITPSLKIFEIFKILN